MFNGNRGKIFLPPIEKKRIITHRGLEPYRYNHFSESSIEAFENQLSRGFGGIEFDPNLTNDGIVVMHDANLSRLTNGKDTRNVSDILTNEITQIHLDNGRIPTFQHVMGLIRQSNTTINAMHLKAAFQSPEALERIMNELRQNEDIFFKLLVFDVKPDTARVLKKKFPSLRLAPSIADSYDINRYNEFVGGTLMKIEEAIALKKEGAIDGVWGDEWDTQGPDNTKKQFYTKENFDRLKAEGLFIALVTPELHATSPGLYGNESHADAKDMEMLFKKIKQIKEAGPDFFCTDFPEDVAKL